MPRNWPLLGEGSYNLTYLSPSKKKVLKLLKSWGNASLDNPQRSVRLWNEINAHFSPPAEIYNRNDEYGWTCPFVPGRQSTDAEMSEALINIFNTTGRIVVDAPAEKNFITTPKGQVVCVDIGMALLLENGEMGFYSDKKCRRRSLASLSAWRELMHDFQVFYEAYQPEYPHTVASIKALLLLKEQQPDFADAGFLKDNMPLVHKLAEDYDEAMTKPDASNSHPHKAATPDFSRNKKSEKKEQSPLFEIQLERAFQLQPTIAIEDIKTSCSAALNEYIQSRATMKESGSYTLSLMTEIFRDKTVTSDKINYAKTLIFSVNSADTLDDLNFIFTTTEDMEPKLKQGRFSSGLMHAIQCCQKIITTAASASAANETISPPKAFS